MHPVLGVAAVLGEFAAMMAGLRAWQRLGSPQPETTRKALHIGVGAVAMALPWVFASPGPIVARCALVAVAMWVARRLPALRGVVCVVERESWGDICFPVAVAVTFVAARGKELLYAVPTLTLADATAAPGVFIL
jgi:phytol kinase